MQSIALTYVIDAYGQNENDMGRINQRILCACQHEDAPSDANQSVWHQPQFAPVPQKERQRVKWDDEPAKVGARECRKDNQVGKQES